MLDAVWAFLRGATAPEGLYQSGHNGMLYRDDFPNAEVGVEVSGSFPPTGDVVPSIRTPVSSRSRSTGSCPIETRGFS
jgi:hypothetical protein